MCTHTFTHAQNTVWVNLNSFHLSAPVSRIRPLCTFIHSFLLIVHILSSHKIFITFICCYFRIVIGRQRAPNHSRTTCKLQSQNLIRIVHKIWGRTYFRNYFFRIVVVVACRFLARLFYYLMNTTSHWLTDSHASTLVPFYPPENFILPTNSNSSCFIFHPLKCQAKCRCWCCCCRCDVFRFGWNVRLSHSLKILTHYPHYLSQNN